MEMRVVVAPRSLHPGCYYPKEANIVSTHLHCFSDASEKAYLGVVYLRMTDSNGKIYTSLVMSKPVSLL